ncbi:MAG: hypothetical protein H0U03_14590 [Actinobacteria bacterium]|nr:hypothetical protein [Actinomycetota bacterium]
MSARTSLFALAAVFCAGALATGGALAARDSGKSRVLALAFNGLPTATPASGVDLAVSAGARGSVLSYTWQELEPSPGRYATRQMSGLRYFTQTRKLKVFLGLQVIETTVKATPGDLVHVSFDAPEMKRRFRALVDALRPYLNENVTYISVGNGVDMYLARHPAAWPAYREFYADAARYLHSVAPWIKVGVTTTFSGAVRKARRKVADLNRLSDVQMITYYPVQGLFQVRPPSVVLGDLRALLEISGSRPLVLPEIGYPSAPALGSSQKQQSAFVDALFSAWRRLGNRIPFLNLLYLHDLEPRACSDMAAFYGHARTEFRTFVCSLGFRQADGSPKAAWKALLTGASALR